MTAFSDLYGALLPMILQVISAVLGLLLIRLSSVARERWGIEVEARMREALHSALMTGITGALGRGLSGKEAVAAAVAHAVQRGAPDAIASFGLSEDALADMAMAKLHEVINSSPLFKIGLSRAGVDGQTGDDPATEAAQ